jgi:leucine dehydrogenase
MELKHRSNYLTVNSEEDTVMSTNLPKLPPNYADVFHYAQSLNYGELHFKLDQKTGLFAIVAIHNTKLGPAIGGCRCIAYSSTNDAIVDALRLAHMMSYKAAICGLPHGGAKSVLIKPDIIQTRIAYFQSFGRFVNQLNGRYITAVDSGTSVEDMDIIATQTKYVTCTKKEDDGDPSPFTALGVRRGIEAAVKFKLGRDTLHGIHIVIQGAGHVGYYLAKELSQLGTKITMTDINSANLQRCVDEFGVTAAPPESIYATECDVFAPCALGATLNPNSIKQLRTAIVAGSANNQLEDTDRDDKILFERGILYAPDFLINAGGLIHAAAIYDHGDVIKANQQIYNLYDAAMNIFQRAAVEHQPTHRTAETIAEERLK